MLESTRRLMLIDPQTVVLFDHFARFLRLARAHALDVAPLKGAHLSTSVYPVGESRGTLADVDFLVRERDFERAFLLLERQGFARRHHVERPDTDRVAEDVGFWLEVAPGSSILFEVHRHLERLGRHPIDYDALWGRAVPSTFDGVPCLRLAAEDHLLHAVIHLYTDRFIQPRRALRDIELLLTAGTADLDVVCRRAREWECTRAAWVALRLLQDVRPALELGPALEALRPSRAVARALHWLVPGPDGFRFAGAGMRVEQALLWPWLMENPLRAARFAASFAALRLRELRSRYSK